MLKAEQRGINIMILLCFTNFHLMENPILQGHGGPALSTKKLEANGIPLIGMKNIFGIGWHKDKLSG